MTDPVIFRSIELVNELHLCDGFRYRFIGLDEPSRSLVAGLADVMQLRLKTGGRQEPNVSVMLMTGRESGFQESCGYLRVPVIDPGCSATFRALQLMKSSSVIARDVEKRGGLLIHGALAERDGYGVLLAGPGGVGKTTASRRLPYPWRSLCDDTTLVVKGPGDGYWAHPWPTWSRWMLDNSGGSWDVQRAVPLRAVFFLAQDHKDRAEPVGAGKAATLLVEAASQVYTIFPENLDKAMYRALNLKRFDNICALVGSVPCFEMRLSLTGAFWREMERVLGGVSISESLQISLGS